MPLFTLPDFSISLDTSAAVTMVTSDDVTRTSVSTVAIVSYNPMLSTTPSPTEPEVLQSYCSAYIPASSGEVRISLLKQDKMPFISNTEANCVELWDGANRVKLCNDTAVGGALVLPCSTTDRFLKISSTGPSVSFFMLTIAGQ